VGVKDVAKGSRAMPGARVRYLSVTEGSRAMLRHQEWYLGDMEGFRVTVEYLDITDGSGATMGSMKREAQNTLMMCICSFCFSVELEMSKF
jgi:hypothetical protein